MKRLQNAYVLSMGLTALPICAGAQIRSTMAQIEQRAEVIKPAPNELKWQRIPWVTDLASAKQMAQAEHRPIFLWVTGDDPLERC